MRIHTFPLTFLTLLVVAVLILPSSSIQPTIQQSSDKLSFVFARTLKPFNNMYDSLHGGVQGHLAKVVDFLVNQVSGENSNTNTADPTPMEIEIIGLSKEQPEPEETRNLASVNVNESFGRFLAGEKGQTGCSNNGKLVQNVRTNIYTCNGKTVTRAYYDTLNGEGCTISRQRLSLCYCSFEFYGDNCENYNFFNCDVKRVTYPQNCTGVNSFNYVFGYSGSPPCYPVSLGSTVTLTNNVSCSYNQPQWAYEGIKPSLYEVERQPTLGTPFTYPIDTPNFKLTASNTDIRQQVSFFDFNRISQPLNFITELTSSQLSGLSSVNTTVTFDSNLGTYTSMGRYYYEINIMANVSSRGSVAVTNQFAGGYFENAAYKEPKAGFRMSSAVIGVLAALGALLLLGALMAYKVHQKRSLRNLIDRTQFTPILGDQ